MYLISANSRKSKELTNMSKKYCTDKKNKKMSNENTFNRTIQLKLGQTFWFHTKAINNSQMKYLNLVLVTL